MKINEIKAKSIIVRSGLPDSDFAINPYTGCSHACRYCYARFMRRFSRHEEEWGNFTDVKINGADLIPKKKEKYAGKNIVIGTVCDPYQPAERQYGITGQILKKLAFFDSNFTIITKSDLIIRDIGLLKQFQNLTVAFSLAYFDDKIRKELEPGAPSVENRISALKVLYDNNIRTALFISPLLPKLSDWQKLINQTRTFTDEYWFENLKIYPSVKNNIYGFLNKEYPELIDEYKDIYSNERSYWRELENEIRSFCDLERIEYKIYFK
jgi:DNA repair photolyase